MIQKIKCWLGFHDYDQDIQVDIDTLEVTGKCFCGKQASYRELMNKLRGKK